MRKRLSEGRETLYTCALLSRVVSPGPPDSHGDTLAVLVPPGAVRLRSGGSLFSVLSAA